MEVKASLLDNHHGHSSVYLVEAVDAHAASSFGAGDPNAVGNQVRRTSTHTSEAKIISDNDTNKVTAADDLPDQQQHHLEPSDGEKTTTNSESDVPSPTAEAVHAEQ